MTLLNVRPLRTSPAFRRLWVGTGALTVGAQFTTVAVLAQVWAVTASSVAVGAVGIAQAVALGAGSLAGGWLADTRDRRQVIVLATTAQLATATSLAALAATQTRSLSAILGVVALHAAGNGVGAPARRALIPGLLPARDVGAGIALNHLTFQGALLNRYVGSLPAMPSIRPRDAATERSAASRWSPTPTIRLTS